MKSKYLLRLVSLVLLPCFVTSCAIIGYSVKPDQAWDVPRPTQTINNKLYYKVSHLGGLTFGGETKLRALMRQNQVFRELEQVSEMPEHGLYLDIAPKYIDPSPGSMVWGYVALSLLFILPAYVGSSGYYAQYHVYRDGKKLKFYEYEIRRKAFAWLPLIPFVWINLMTSSEEDAFEATTQQFFQDALRDGVFMPMLEPSDS